MSSDFEASDFGFEFAEFAVEILGLTAAVLNVAVEDLAFLDFSLLSLKQL